jgi:hypothetical protein
MEEHTTLGVSKTADNMAKLPNIRETETTETAVKVHNIQSN